MQITSAPRTSRTIREPVSSLPAANRSVFRREGAKPRREIQGASLIGVLGVIGMIGIVIGAHALGHKVIEKLSRGSSERMAGLKTLVIGAAVVFGSLTANFIHTTGQPMNHSPFEMIMLGLFFVGLGFGSAGAESWLLPRMPRAH